MTKGHFKRCTVLYMQFSNVQYQIFNFHGAKKVMTPVKVILQLYKLYDDFDFDFQPQPEGFWGRSPSLSLPKAQICGAEVWSSEVEVKLIEGHGGEVHSLTCRDDSPSLWPYLEMRLLAHLRNSLPRGVKRVDPVCRITTQLQHSFLKRCTRRPRRRVEGCMSKIPLLAFSTPPPLKSYGCPCYAAKRVWVLQ